AAGARAHLERDRGHLAPRPRQQIAAQGPAQPRPIRLRQPPALPATEAAVQAPPPPVVLAVVDRRPLGRVAGNHPRAPRPPLTGPGAPHAHRGVVVAAVLAMAALAPRGELAAWPPSRAASSASSSKARVGGSQTSTSPSALPSSAGRQQIACARASLWRRRKASARSRCASARAVVAGHYPA